MTLQKKILMYLLAEIKPLNEHQVVIGGVVVGTVAALWPFVIAYLRGRISEKQVRKGF